MRNFTYSDATSHKFWNIEVSGTSFTVTYGKIGGKGQTQTKSFATPEKAQAEAEKLIREKVSKGYTETTVGVSAPTANPQASLQQALEAALMDDPLDVSATMAYADWLADQGDPRGEFVRVQLALEDPQRSAAERKRLKKEEKALLDKHGAEWVGDWADLVPKEAADDGQIDFPTPGPYAFERGILTEVAFRQLTVAAVRAFIKAPQTRMVRCLRIGMHAYAEDDAFEPEPGEKIPEDAEFPAEHLLLRSKKLAPIRIFQLGWTANEQYDDYVDFRCWTAGEHAHDYVKQMPRLEELYLFAHRVEGNKLFALPLPELRVVQLYHSHRYGLKKLAANASLTKLTHLLCHPHAHDFDEEGASIQLADLKAIARSPHLRSLTHLRLRLADFGDAGCAELVDSGLLGRLEVLDLRHGMISDEGARRLAACPDIKKLKLLDLSRNELTDEGIAALKATGVTLEVNRQYQPGAGARCLEGDEGFLYDGDIE